MRCGVDGGGGDGGEGRARRGDVGRRVHQLSVYGRGWGWRRSGGEAPFGFNLYSII